MVDLILPRRGPSYLCKSREEPETSIYFSRSGVSGDRRTVDTYIKSIKYGSGITLASVAVNVSNVASYYFLSNPVFTATGLPSNDLRWLTGFYATLNDGAKDKKVLIGAEGTVETTTELLADTGFDNAVLWLTEAGWAIGSSKATATALASSKYVYQNIAANPGSLVKTAYTCSDYTGGNFRVSVGSGGTGTINSSAATFTQYINRGTGTLIGLTWVNSALTASFSSLSAQQVLTPSATGTWFTPVSEDSGWSPNAAAYTITVTRS